jgi:hypothetical protein
MPILLLKLLPYAVILALLSATYFAGANTVQRKWDAHEAQVKDQTKLIVDDAQRRVAFISNTAAELNKHIEETNLANRKIIESISSRNNDAVAVRVQHDRAACGRISMPGNAIAAKSSNGASDSRNRTFLEESGKSLVESAKYADELSNSLKSCRDYITSLQVLNK